jgi:hypothetical protein
VVGNIPDGLEAKNHFRATRFLGFAEDLEPIFRSVRIGSAAVAPIKTALTFCRKRPVAGN